MLAPGFGRTGVAGSTRVHGALTQARPGAAGGAVVPGHQPRCRRGSHRRRQGPPTGRRSGRPRASRAAPAGAPPRRGRDAPPRRRPALRQPPDAPASPDREVPVDHRDRQRPAEPGDRPAGADRSQNCRQPVARQPARCVGQAPVPERRLGPRSGRATGRSGRASRCGRRSRTRTPSSAGSARAGFAIARAIRRPPARTARSDRPGKGDPTGRCPLRPGGRRRLRGARRTHPRSPSALRRTARLALWPIRVAVTPSSAVAPPVDHRDRHVGPVEPGRQVEPARHEVRVREHHEGPRPWRRPSPAAPARRRRRNRSARAWRPATPGCGPDWRPAPPRAGRWPRAGIRDRRHTSERSMPSRPR